jgi:indolepyruvate ferredoxin oxidoreductase, beta subunit
MRYDVVAAGVGGQGVLLVARCLAAAALAEGLRVKQSETHGMAQRGGSVVSYIRIGDGAVHSPLVSPGTASLLLGFELLEAVRSLEYLAPDGKAVASTETVANIPNYPDPDVLIRRLGEHPGARFLDPRSPAREAGSARAANLVLLGAAAAFLPIRRETLETSVERLFESASPKIRTCNLRAFELGRALRFDHGPATN